MKYNGKIKDPKDLVTKEYVDAKSGGDADLANTHRDIITDKLYREVDYIEGHGNEYIDTGVASNLISKRELVFSDITTTATRSLCGAWTNNTATKGNYYLRFIPDTNGFLVYGRGTSKSLATSVDPTGKYKFIGAVSSVGTVP